MSILPCWGWRFRETAVAQGVFHDVYTDDLFHPDGRTLADVMIDVDRALRDGRLARPCRVTAFPPPEYQAEHLAGRETTWWRVRRIRWNQHPMSETYTPILGDGDEVYEILPLDSTARSHGVVIRRTRDDGAPEWWAVDGNGELPYDRRSWAIWDLAVHGALDFPSASSWVRAPSP